MKFWWNLWESERYSVTRLLKEFFKHPKKSSDKSHSIFLLCVCAGYLLMTDDWFSEYVFEIAVDKKYIPTAVLEVLSQEPKVLPAWDPMGALAGRGCTCDEWHSSTDVTSSRLWPVLCLHSSYSSGWLMIVTLVNNLCSSCVLQCIVDLMWFWRTEIKIE